MELREVRSNAREKMKGFCNLCTECNGVWCAGQVPGMGGAGTGESFKRSFEKLKNIKLSMKTLHSATNPNTSFAIFGEKLSIPVITAPITGTKFNMGGGVSDEEYINDVVFGSLDAGTIAMIGDTGDSSCYVHGIEALKKSGGKSIAIIKPRENSEIIYRIKMAEEAGALAVGVDIDGAGLVTMKLFGQPVGPKTPEELKELVSSTELPFIVKGVLSVEEAKICVKAGAAAIVVSNHGGRVLNHTLAPCEVLGDIVKAVGDDIIVLADGNVREGADVIKYIALGAKGVLIGRPVIWGSIGGRQEGVKTVLETIKSQLYQGMILTGSHSIDSIDKDKIIL
ncbi:alpha-hydroxy-acid oxidizing protein [Ilyobacter sp.]|uniref:alpha-hydroxy-acid oxidizing protein n=1 Tax=Ilyobacter sp. TaxID=3100343 RepID=UPI003563503C